MRSVPIKRHRAPSLPKPSHAPLDGGQAIQHFLRQPIDFRQIGLDFLRPMGMVRIDGHGTELMELLLDGAEALILLKITILFLPLAEIPTA